MNYLAHIICILILITVIGCNSSSKPQSGAVVKEIPENRKNDYMRTVKFDIEKLLNLDDLEKGFDSIEIRLWFSNSTNEEKLIII
ncbi:hypothetical protein, partial [Flavihumibacter sp. CACIAM 22H1]|uniref:hypothetical protein n=1 Tax=Flavihumibacter sp. CACIAM 22H1 TaxID=1812911 RepID=UPI000AB3B044